MIENIIEKKYRNRFDKNEKEDSHSNNNHLFVCEICGTNMPIKDKEDHLLCHKIESEERKNDIVINLLSNEVNEQDSQYMSKKFINKAYAFDYYPTSLIKDINKLAEDKKRCGICLENFQNGDESIFLSCAHIFHSKCIRRWVKRRKACPFCNYKINIPRLINKATSENRNNINFGVTDFSASGRSNDSGGAQSYENENSYNSNSNSYYSNSNSNNSNSNSYNSNINSIDYSSSYYNSNENSILHFRSSHNSYNSNLFNSNSYNSNSNSVATSNSNLNSNSSSNSNSNSNQVNDSLLDYIRGNYSIKNKESSKYSLNNDINKSNSNQNKEESNYSIKNITSNEENEKDNEDENEDGKEDAEKNELQKNKKRYENISIDNNIEILYILNLKRNSLTYIDKNDTTKITHRTSILSSKINNQNLKYNYLNNLPLKEKIKSRKRSISTEIVDIKAILNKEVLAKNKNTEILLDKLKNLNMSLEKEKSYVKYFKCLTEKKYPYYNIQNKMYNNSNNSNYQKYIISSQIKLFVKSDNNLHKKVHKSNIFDKLRKNINI